MKLFIGNNGDASSRIFLFATNEEDARKNSTEIKGGKSLLIKKLKMKG